MKWQCMIQELLKANHIDMSIPSEEREQEALLKKLMTICKPAHLSEDYYKKEREYLAEKRSQKNIVSVESIKERLIDNIYIYLGDITTIKADAIVNAANEKLLGCFVPGHHCIDNAIHLAAGLKLRNACNTIMRQQGHDELPGQAKITEGFELPAKYVMHTVGPNIHALQATKNSLLENRETIKRQLAECYNSIITLASSQLDINNIVFCSISTGVYGVSIQLASEIALTTIVNHQLYQQRRFDKIIINVFSEEDYCEYKRQAQKIKQQHH